MGLHQLDHLTVTNSRSARSHSASRLDLAAAPLAVGLAAAACIAGCGGPDATAPGAEVVASRAAGSVTADSRPGRGGAPNGSPVAKDGLASLALIAESHPAKRSRAERGLQGDAAQQEALEARRAYLETDPLVQELRRMSFEELLERLRPAETESPEDYFQRQLMTRPFVPTDVDATSTFGLETDTASYAFARARIESGALPAPWSVRVEEFVHAIDSDIPAPRRGDFSISTDLLPSPFGRERAWMLRVGLRARDVEDFERGPLALTFVVDRSGSMNSGERMPMVKNVLGLLAGQLDARDQVAVVTYASDAQVLIEPTSGDALAGAMDAIRSIETGGSTNIDEGLALGCDLAAGHYLPGAQNFVVLLSDGLGNVGETEADALLAKTREARDAGLFLNTVGVGMTARDRFLERLANAGDGRCDYVDREEEARRAFVDRFTGAFQVVAKDAKLQVEFDPALVGRWRLVGYENRALADADFTDDTVDAGEIGAGHSVAALYELEDVRFEGDRPLGEVRLRYVPEGDGDAIEAEWGIELAGLHPDFDAAPASLRAQVCMAQFGELVARNAHALGDAPADLVATAQRVQDRWQDADFADAVELMAAAERLLVERDAGDGEPVMDIGRQLAFAHYQSLLEQRRDPSSEAATAAAETVGAMEAAFHAEVDRATGGTIESDRGEVPEPASGR